MKVAFVLLLATAGISSATESCGSLVGEVCHSENSPSRPPSTVEDLDEYCRFAIAYLECGIEHFIKCDDEDENRLTLFTETKTGLETICDKDSRLYKGLGENIGCLAENTAQFRGCPLRKEAEYSEARYIEALGKHDLGHLAVPDNRDCLKTLFDISCFAIQSERKCGNGVQDLVIELILEFPFAYSPCSDEILENLPQLTKMLEREDEEYSILEELLRRR